MVKKGSKPQPRKNIKPADKGFGRKIGDTERWLYGFILLFLSLFVLLSVVSYYLTWSDDQSLLREGISWGDVGEVSNHAGKLGAFLGSALVARMFGVFALCIPVVLIILSLRIVRVRPLFLNRSVRLSFIVMILGSVTLGYIFGTRWGVFGTGLGGEAGIASAQWLQSVLGGFGLGLLLLMCWVLLAVYINRSTIKVVNRVGKAVTDGAANLLTRKPREALVQEEAIMEERLWEEEEIIPEYTPHDTDELFEVQGVVRDEPIPASTLSADIEIIRDDAQYPFIDDEPETTNLSTVAQDGDFIIEGFTKDEREEEPEPKEEPDDEDDDFVVVDQQGKRIKASAFRDSPRRATPLGAGAVVVGDEEGIEVVMQENVNAQADEEAELDFRDPTRRLPRYQRPPWVVLKEHSTGIKVTDEEIRANQEVIREKLDDFGIKIADRIKATIGPTVTLYEIEPAQGVKVSRIRGLEEDIALALKVQSIRIVTLGQGRGTIGIEVPNSNREVVSMLSMIKSIKFQDCNYKLPMVLGKTIYNEIYIGDLTKMPHLLVAGATGQGKSVGLNAIITSLLYKKHPAELKFVLIDPKQVELSVYKRLEKHFLAKMESEDNAIITDTQKAVNTLNSLVMVMESRYTLLNKAGVRNLSDYNDKLREGKLKHRDGHEFMPYIVVVIDEFADMIMTVGREAEIPITRLAAKARAVGIHLIVATQRPDVKVITGLIKSNIPARIAFKVVSMVDSRTIIDQPGANNLIGMGDMLMYLNGELTRVQCAFVDTPEIENIVSFISQQDGYEKAFDLPHFESKSTGGDGGGESSQEGESILRQVAYFVVQNKQGSTSAIQRNFRLGYNRAGRIMDKLEKVGVVGRQDGSRPREVIVSDLRQLEDILMSYDDNELDV